MADKQATVYVIDVGVSTANCRSGRIESDVCISSSFLFHINKDCSPLARAALVKSPGI